MLGKPHVGVVIRCLRACMGWTLGSTCFGAMLMLLMTGGWTSVLMAYQRPSFRPVELCRDNRDAYLSWLQFRDIHSHRTEL